MSILFCSFAYGVLCILANAAFLTETFTLARIMLALQVNFYDVWHDFVCINC